MCQAVDIVALLLENFGRASLLMGVAGLSVAVALAAWRK